MTYVSIIKDRLQNACELASTTLHQSQQQMKKRYDKNTILRTFDPGGKVLIFLPITGQPLSARYYGPYEIESRQNELNYVVKTPDRRKPKQLCHINLIKVYHSKESDKVPINTVGVVIPLPETEHNKDDYDIGTDLRLRNSELLNSLEVKLDHLESEQQSELTHTIRQYCDLFPDGPTETSIVYHDVEIGDAAPIKQHPYRVNPIKLKAMREEIKYMLQNGIIEFSNSDFSSPSMLVSKP